MSGVRGRTVPRSNVSFPSAHLPPPSVVVPVLANGAAGPGPSGSGYGFFNPAPAAGPDAPAGPVSAGLLYRTAQSSFPSPAPKPSPPREEQLNIGELFSHLSQPSDNAGLKKMNSAVINDSIQSLQSIFAPTLVEESPASPPPGGVVAGDAPLIPTSRPYVAIPLFVPDAQLDLNLIQVSLLVLRASDAD